MSALDSDPQQEAEDTTAKSKQFANVAIGLFFLVSAISVVLFMSLLLLKWQPIWTEGFKDFHTISDAIGELDQTAQPASDVIPLMLAEMVQMNKNMVEMQTIMREMDQSMGEIEKVKPNIQHMTASINSMNSILQAQMTNMVYLMDRIENKLPDMDFMPFN